MAANGCVAPARRDRLLVGRCERGAVLLIFVLSSVIPCAIAVLLRRVLREVRDAHKHHRRKLLLIILLFVLTRKEKSVFFALSLAAADDRTE